MEHTRRSQNPYKHNKNRRILRIIQARLLSRQVLRRGGAKPSFTFVDLFAGIGGMRIAFEKAGGRCVFSSEINHFARETYSRNFAEEPAGDITKIKATEIPNHDILAAGFPCQPFSGAGVSKMKSLNRPHGFEDETQGTLFFDIVRILRAKQPKAFLLENVKHLKGHNKGRTFKTILRTLKRRLNYDIHFQIFDASMVVPQHRERIFIVGFKKPLNFRFPKIPDTFPSFREILEKRPSRKYTITDGVWTALKRHKRESRAIGNGFGYHTVDPISEPYAITRTLSARYYKDGAEILIKQKNGKNPRRLTPRECARLMGFPESFKIIVSDTQAYRQFGNSLVVPLVTKIAKEVVKCMKENKKRITILDYA